MNLHFPGPFCEKHRWRQPMKPTLTACSVALALVLPAAAWAQEAPAIPEEAKAAEEVLVRYLNAVKARKWAEAKKLIHPRTLAAIAERKKRLGDEDHPMAPWYYEKAHSFMKDYKIVSATPGPAGTWIFATTEDNFQVEEQGLSEGDEAAYLVGQTGGKWMVVDKKRGVSFTKDSIRYGYKGYFDAEKKAARAEEE
jgi:hypothetical protein